MENITALADQLDNVLTEPATLLPNDFDPRPYDRGVKNLISEWTNKGTNNIFIDIETLPSGTYPSVDEIDVPKNYKNPETIQKYIENNIEKIYKRQALDSTQGRVLCIGIAVNGGDPAVIVGDSEEHLFLKLDALLVLSDYQWIAHNAKFDLLWLYQRAIKYNCRKLFKMINPERYKGNIIDTIDLLGGCVDYTYKISLDNAAQFLNLETSKGDVHGANIYDNWMAGNHAEIFKYCKDDVRLLREIFNACNL